MKEMDKTVMTSAQQILFKREIDVLKLMKHKNVIEQVESFESFDKIFLVFDLVMGGTLRDYI